MPINPETGLYDNDQPSYFPHSGGLAGVDILNQFRGQGLANQAQESRDLAQHMRQLQYDQANLNFENDKAFQQSVAPGMSNDDMLTKALQFGQPAGALVSLNNAETRATSAEAVAKTKTEALLALQQDKDAAAMARVNARNDNREKVTRYANGDISAFPGSTNPKVDAQIAVMNNLMENRDADTQIKKQRGAAYAGLSGEMQQLAVAKQGLIKATLGGQIMSPMDKARIQAIVISAKQKAGMQKLAVLTLPDKDPRKKEAIEGADDILSDAADMELGLKMLDAPEASQSQPAAPKKYTKMGTDEQGRRVGLTADGKIELIQE